MCSTQQQYLSITQSGALWLQFGTTDAVRACGMAMCVRLTHHKGNHEESALLVCVAGYEDGSVGVWDEGNQQVPRMLIRVHEQPVMALAIRGGGQGMSLHPFPMYIICLCLIMQAPCVCNRRRLWVGR